MPYARLHFFVSFMEKKPCIKFYDVFDRFLRTYEVATFPEISDVTRADEDANCGLHVNFWKVLLMPTFLWWKRIILSRRFDLGLTSSLRKFNKKGIDPCNGTPFNMSTYSSIKLKSVFIHSLWLLKFIVVNQTYIIWKKLICINIDLCDSCFVSFLISS